MRFTIRDVLWLTVVVALLCTWWLGVGDGLTRNARLSSENQELKKQRDELLVKLVELEERNQSLGSALNRAQATAKPRP
jgi:cell shape-determining protein MreC